ncbi:alpha-L-fucosidase [Macrosteles quadrilineatus]|uniref:alpha-L-fucosidase n=1 Tax=Macrosteles quadrilineatus TaxID=74068 RepID=UPI0023E0F967|nr:alpha-L-fucosidase [Macrosteles quadrilineatus]
MTSSAITTFLVICLSLQITNGKYEPTWDSIDARPLPDWYDEAKLGVFIHWGVFAVQSYSTEWAWFNWKENKSSSLVQYIEDNYPKGFTYQDFAKDFKAELYDPDRWAKIIGASGARYVVLTSKHHEGFAMWPSKYSFSWNAMDVGPHRDLVGELRTAFENYTDIKFGLYHSLYEWYNPLYLADKARNFTNLGPVNFADSKIFPEMVELVEQYKPHVFWSDGEWEAPTSYWKSLEFLAWLYNESPVRDTVVVNDRWGHDTLCKHGGFLTCADRFNPGKLQTRKFENAMTIDRKSWGYRRTASLSDYLTINQLLVTLTTTVSCGGNVLVNIGPTKDGIIPPIYEERLLQLGSWMKVNGEAIYSSKPWIVCQNDSLTPGIWYTTNKDKTVLYATFSPWPVDNKLKMSCPEFSAETTIELLGLRGKLSYSYPTDVVTGRLVEIQLPDKARVASEWVWTLKMKGVKNLQESYETVSEREFEAGITVKSNGFQQMLREVLR